MKTLILASHNPGKLQEFQQIFRNLPVNLTLFNGQIAEETGTTYFENSKIKATSVAQQTGHWALADDSGIEVDFLEGAPGVFSARFVSEDSWTNTREILLRMLSAKPLQRTARMRSVLCLSSPQGEVVYAEGILEGMILGWPRGRYGFGMDPIFSVDGQTSLSEISEDAKNKISHRGKSSRIMQTILEERLSL